MKKLLTLLLLCLSTAQLFSQNTKQVKGKVTDENGAALAGANVLLSGARQGSQTDNTGNFTIRIPADGKKHDLVISYVGFAAKTVSTDGSADVNVSLVKETATTDEVVVIGYQTIKKRDLTGSVSSLAAKEIKDIPVNSTAEALVGRLAGVRIVVNEGMPGADAEINIRGRNSITQNGSPLYIVDGVQLENALNVLSPQDIASIDVLKDASATAIYGARGSNGVVIITTKGGKNTGGRTTVTYSGFEGVSNISKKLDVLQPYDYVLYQWERAKFSGDTTAISRYTRNVQASQFDTINTYKNYPFTDWQNIMMGRTALQQTHNVSISGGNDKTQYNVSLTANYQDGILLNSGYNRKIASFRLDHTANDKMKFGFTFRYLQQSVNGAGTSDVGGAGSNNLRQYVRYRPIELPGENDDTFDPAIFVASAGNGLNLIDPKQNVYAQYRQRNTSTYDITTYVNYNLTKNLSFRATFGYDAYTLTSNAFDDTLTTNSRAFGKQPLLNITTNGRVTLNNSNVISYHNTALFKNPKHSLDVVVGEESYQTVNNDSYLELRYFPLGTTPTIAFANFGLAAAPAGFTQPKPTSDQIPVNNISFFSRINYTFNRKYLATFTFRADGSSLFGDSHKWGYFPSGSLAWRVSEENFMKKISAISDMKLRVSYGTAGNNRIPAYSYANAYNVGNGYGINNSLAYSLTPTATQGNPDLQWETLISRNIGLDLGFFKNKLLVTIDAYSNTTNNLLVGNAVPPSSGYTTQLQNLGSTRNNGLEIQISAPIMRKKDFSWTVNYNMSFNDNIILSLGSQKQFLFNSGWFGASNPADYIVKVGEQVGTMYGYLNDGWYKTSDFTTTPYTNASFPLYTTQYALKAGVPNVVPGVSTILAQPGMPKFKDINGDGLINASDEAPMGHAQPIFIGGLNQQFTYKDFDMSIFLNFSYGNQVYNANKIEFTNAYSNDANLLTLTKGRWHNIDAKGNSIQGVIGGTVVAGVDPATMDALNTNTSYWIPTTGQNAYYPMSYAIEDGSFIRINNITLGYSLPKKLLQKAGIASLRFYVTGNNLAVLTGYTGFDPEANTRRGTPATPGVDYGSYPRSRTFIFGLNMSL